MLSLEVLPLIDSGIKPMWLSMNTPLFAHFQMLISLPPISISTISPDNPFPIFHFSSLHNNNRANVVTDKGD